MQGIGAGDPAGAWADDFETFAGIRDEEKMALVTDIIAFVRGHLGVSAKLSFKAD
jgi:hypothetical protein